MRCDSGNLALGLGTHDGDTRARSPIPPMNSEIPKSIDGGGTGTSAGVAARRRTSGEDGLWQWYGRSGSLLLASHRRRLSGGEETAQLLYLAAGRKGVADASALDAPDACWHRLGGIPSARLLLGQQRRDVAGGIEMQEITQAAARCVGPALDLARRRRSLTQLPARRRSVTRACHE